MIEEQPKSQEFNDTDGFIPIKDLDSLGYYAGSTYRGFHSNGLFVNLKELEEMCRVLNLPPIQIADLSYTPPRADEPDSIGFGLAAWKRSLFSRPSGIDVDELCRVEFLPGCYNTEVPLGYRICIAGQGIYDHINQNNQNDMQERYLFSNHFNKLIMAALNKINTLEYLNRRLEGIGSEAKLNELMGIMASVLSSPFGYLVPGNFLDRMASIVFADGFFQSGMYGYNEYSDSRDIAHVPARNIPSTISEFWRKVNFPERFSTEPPPGFPGWQRYLMMGIPYGGTIMNHKIRFALAKTQYPGPLISL